MFVIRTFCIYTSPLLSKKCCLLHIGPLRKPPSLHVEFDDYAKRFFGRITSKGLVLIKKYLSFYSYNYSCFKKYSHYSKAFTSNCPGNTQNFHSASSITLPFRGPISSFVYLYFLYNKKNKIITGVILWWYPTRVVRTVLVGCISRSRVKQKCCYLHFQQSSCLKPQNQ